MSTLTLKEIVFLWDEKAITAERMRELLTDVMEPQALPKVHELSMTTFRKQVKTDRSCQRYSAEETAQIAKGIKDGYTHRAIGKTLGRSTQAINHRAHVMKRKNKPVRSTGGGQMPMQP